MNGLKYFFPGPSKLWTIFVLFFFVIIGCQDGCRCLGCGGCNGCTTSVVIDQEARKIKVDGMKMKVIANKNRVTNRKLKLDTVLYVDKTVWYTVDYHLRVENRPDILNICDYEVQKDLDLEKSLDRFNVYLSPDKQHFAVGLDNKVYDFFHMLADGVPFSSGCYYSSDSSYAYFSEAQLDFKDIKWNKFPNPDALLDKIIVPNNYSVWALRCNRENILSLLAGLPPGNSHDMVLIENWFCEIAEIHFNQQRVESIVKVSPKWKMAAEKSLIKYIDSSISENDPQLKSSLDMVLWINDLKLLNAIDSIAFNDYFAAGKVGDYFVQRFNNTKLPINSKIRTKIIAEAKKMGSNTFVESEKMAIETAVDLLLILKDYKVLRTFLDKNIRMDVIDLYSVPIFYATMQKYDKYPKDLQKVMVNNYYQIVKNPSQLSSFDISQVVEFLKDKIECKELKQLVEIHKNSLVAFSLPPGCK